MISDFVESYGYLAVFAGTLLEGEAILIADVKRIEGIVLIVILAAGAAFWLWRRSRARMGDQAATTGRKN